MTADMLHPSLAPTPITDSNKSELVRAAALQELVHGRSRGLAALKRGMVDVKSALALFAGCGSSFGALFFGQAYLAPEEVAGVLRFSRDVPEDLARALLEVVHSFSEVSLRTFWAAATGRANLDASSAQVAVMMQQDMAAGCGAGLGTASTSDTITGKRSTATAASATATATAAAGVQGSVSGGKVRTATIGEGLVQFVPNARMVLLPRMVDKGGVGLKVLLGQRLLQALNLGEYAYSTEAQQQARLTARELQQIKEGLRGDVREGKPRAAAG